MKDQQSQRLPINALVRESLAQGALSCVGARVDAMILVGSVAYNPLAVSQESDLDLVVLADFSNIDLQAVCSVLFAPYDPTIDDLRKSAKITMFDLAYQRGSVTINTFWWDRLAWDNVANLQGTNPRFIRRPSRPTLQSPRAVQKMLDPQEVFENGNIVAMMPYLQEPNEAYLGVQVKNLLMDPVFLKDPQGHYASQVQQMRSSLQERLKTIYGSSTNECNLLLTLPESYRPKLGPDLTERLRNFF